MACVEIYPIGVNVSFFLKNKKQPRAIEELMTELRVMLDKRRPSSKTNVIDFSHAVDRSKDADFIDEYQALTRAVTHYFFKKEGELTYEDYYYLKQQITELQDTVKRKAKEVK